MLRLETRLQTAITPKEILQQAIARLLQRGLDHGAFPNSLLRTPGLGGLLNGPRDRIQ